MQFSIITYFGRWSLLRLNLDGRNFAQGCEGTAVTVVLVFQHYVLAVVAFLAVRACELSIWRIIILGPDEFSIYVRRLGKEKALTLVFSGAVDGPAGCPST